ncbi:WW domain-containing transcription regulator protein 1 isoform X3 [Poecile atricapillus]|uniref:WW domain-containing transcription regulator protein 1 isoform X3 n=1 Tax=Poecile atricapillus TaxID=48891 RepID=UPI002739E826|nr:WW domain-containing transcription regulator protein 1 isoform X3 [Poecile atricapillus]
MNPAAAAPPPGQQVIHVTQDLDTELEALFNAVMNPRPSSWRKKILPESFFREPDSGSHSRQSSTDSGGPAPRLPPVHGRSHSSPASLPGAAAAPQHGHLRQRSCDGTMDERPLPPGWEMALTQTGQRYFLKEQRDAEKVGQCFGSAPGDVNRFPNVWLWWCSRKGWLEMLQGSSHRKNYNMARSSKACEPAAESCQPPSCHHVHTGATEVHDNVSAKSHAECPATAAPQPGRAAAEPPPAAPRAAQPARRAHLAAAAAAQAPAPENPDGEGANSDASGGVTTTGSCSMQTTSYGLRKHGLSSHSCDTGHEAYYK